jgi:hypothetical protein
MTIVMRQVVDDVAREFTMTNNLAADDLFAVESRNWGLEMYPAGTWGRFCR